MAKDTCCCSTSGFSREHGGRRGSNQSSPSLPKETEFLRPAIVTEWCGQSRPTTPQSIPTRSCQEDDYNSTAQFRNRTENKRGSEVPLSELTGHFQGSAVTQTVHYRPGARKSSDRALWFTHESEDSSRTR
ncbi:hypothetical protein SRHO_G00153400 [Serrasalmus rhombeus]